MFGRLKQTQNIAVYPFNRNFFNSANGYNGIAAGDAIIAVICCQFEAPDALVVTSVTDSSGNRWAQVPGLALRGGNESFLDIWVAYDVATVAPSDGLQVTVTTNNPAGSSISDQFNVALLDVEGLSGRTPWVNAKTVNGYVRKPVNTDMVALAGEGPLDGENIAYMVGTGTLQPTFNTELGGEVDIALAIIAFPLKP
jgi:hypothetical protein